uniref:LON peptidase N-terminal domain and RING finger protein 3 n=1 Tax=Scophthalmus maximus TaxID=52904 RepID=A0A8D3DKM3_SCOMX
MGAEGESMLQLAAEAFQSRNFDLAADIYECQLAGARDPGSRQELMVKRADALTFGGKLPEALDVYRQASEIERLKPVHLASLVEHLSASIRRQDAGCGQGRGEEAGAAAAAAFPGAGATGCAHADFHCRMCLSFLFEPVTLPCGHSFCKRCLEREGGERERERPVVCRQCRDSSRVADVQSYRVNVVLSGLLAKRFPALHQAGRLRREGNGLYAERKVEAALEKYNQAILMAPMDHILFSNRSQIHSSLKHYKKALRDAEVTCRLKPRWSKGHIRKAQALVSLGRTEEALREYLVCLSIEPDCRLAKTEAHKPEVWRPVLCFPLKRKRRSSEEEEAEERRQERTDENKRSRSGELLDLTHQHVRTRVRVRVVFIVRSSLHPEPTAATDSSNCDGGDVLEAADLECSLCMRLFYEPVTTPCGHTFCLQCLERCLDHNPKCPLCKEELSEYLVQRQFCKTVLMEKLISKYLPTDLVERQKIQREEMAELSNLNKNVPIFVCTMAFPTVPCPLHIFEPCYRLMIRRCIETGTNCFGMCLADNVKGFADYGCLLEIRDVKFFSDGRSVVNTIGRRRFKVVQHSERDGYNTADIEYLEDVKVEGVAERELESLHDAVYDQALVWVNSLKTEQKERIEGHFGPMPEKDSELQACPNGPSWCWWLLAVLPLEGRAQLPFLAITSLKNRLSGIRKVLLFMAQCRHR